MNVFFDTSAVVKLLAREPDFDLAKSLFDASGRLYAASICYVEARSALGAMSRAGRLRGRHAEHVRLELERIWSDLAIVRLDDRVVALAGDTAERARLRGGDAIHLTSALLLADPELVVATWNPDLAQAAREAGLAVAP